MFDNYIREQCCDKHIIRPIVRLHGRDGRVEAREALAAATGIVLRVMKRRVVRMIARLIARSIARIILIATLLLHRQILLHADHSVVVVMMGEYGCHQHHNVDKKQ